MPRYFFHLHNSSDVTDEEGRELADLAAALDWAKFQARNLAGEMAKEEGRIALHHRIDIANAEGEVLDTVRFGDVIQIER